VGVFKRQRLPMTLRDNAMIAPDDERQIVDDVIDQHQAVPAGLRLNMSHRGNDQEGEGVPGFHRRRSR
jgi:hypothetical protein